MALSKKKKIKYFFYFEKKGPKFFFLPFKSFENAIQAYKKRKKARKKFWTFFFQSEKIYIYFF